MSVLEPDEEKIIIEIPESNVKCEAVVKKYYTIHQFKAIIDESLFEIFDGKNYDLYINDFHLNEYFFPLQLQFFLENFKQKTMQIKYRQNNESILDIISKLNSKSLDQLLYEVKEVENKIKVLTNKEEEGISLKKKLTVKENELLKSLKMLKKDNEGYLKNPSYVGEVNERYVDLKYKESHFKRELNSLKLKLKLQLNKISEYKEVGKAIPLTIDRKRNLDNMQRKRNYDK